MQTFFEKIDNKVDSKILNIQEQSKRDQSMITSLNMRVQQLEGNVKETNESIRSLETQLVTTIDASVKGHLAAYAQSFESKFQIELKKTADIIETTQSERTNILRTECQQFFQEYRENKVEQNKHQQAVSEVLDYVRRQSNSDHLNEILFSPVPQATNTSEANNDLSFDYDHE
jgi:hypothetical protein